MTSRTVVREFMDKAPISRMHILFVAICGSLIAVDGFDTAVVGFVAPSIRQEWAMPPSALAPLFSAGLFGLLLGALIMGPVADRFGRKVVMVACTFMFSAASFAAATSPDFHTLVLMRFLTGLGIGGAFPNAITLASEFLPTRRRSVFVMIAASGFTIGSAVAGFVTAGLVAAAGWRGVMVVSGVAPLIVGLAAMAFLPESPQYLSIRGKDARLRKVLAKIAPLPAEPTEFVADEKPAKAPMIDLFKDGRAPVTLLVWLAFFCSQLVIYLLTNWLPTLLSDAGATARNAALVTSGFMFGGTIGGIWLGFRMDGRNGFAVVSVAYLIGAGAIVCLGLGGGSLWIMALAVFVSGTFVSGSQTGINILTAQFYPGAIRATGVAWATSLGRLGAISGSLLGGVLVGLQMGYPPLFGIVGAICVISAVSLGFLARRVGRANAAAQAVPAE